MDQTHIQTLRAAIARTDRSILELVAKRLIQVKEIAAAKQALGLPFKDLSVEDDVRHHYLQTARELGIPHELAQNISKLLIGYLKNDPSSD